MNNTDVNDLLNSPEDAFATEPVVEVEEKVEPGLDPYKMLEALGGPNKETIERLKAQVPGGRVRIYSPDLAKRVYVLRALSGLEWADARKRVPSNSSDPDNDFSINVAIKSCVWTSTTRTQKLSETELRTGPAGDPSTLFSLVAMLSGFVDPSAFNVLSAEL